MALKSGYPSYLKPKLYVRKTKCFAILSEDDLMEKCRIVAVDVINECCTSTDMKGKLIRAFKFICKSINLLFFIDKYFKQLENIYVIKKSEKLKRIDKNNSNDNDVFDSNTFEENENFPSASSAIKLKYA